MKKILITGGAGFLGSNLCKKLFEIDAQANITCIDNLYTGNLENIKDFLNKKNFTFINHDIINPIDIEVDVIYNLACPASPIHYQKDPLHTLKTSVFGVHNLLKLADKYGAKILQASTSEIYGDPLVHPQEEKYYGNVNPIGPRSCYDEGKRCAETFISDFRRKFGTRTKIARIFNTYGEKMHKDDGRVISNFIIQALKGKDITIYGDGSQTRSFCYVEDLINGLIKLKESDDSVVGPFNLGNPDEYTILEIANKILSKTNSNSKIVYKDLPQDDPKKRRPDIKKAQEILKWQPETNLDTGLNITIEYFKGQI